MNHYPKIPDFLKELGLIPSEKPDPPLEIFFDDEPLECILYAQELQGPTRANLFYPAAEYARKILRAHRGGKIKDLLENAPKLAGPEHPLSLGMCLELAMVMRTIVPDYPNPILPVDLSSLGPLMEKIWNHALEAADKELQETVGSPLYRCYEHYQKYEDARRVLARLIEIDRAKKDPLGEGTMINNLAFEYLLEGRNQEALPLFEQAAAIFEGKNIIDYANARTNYWTCRLEIPGSAEVEGAEAELNTLAEILGKHGDRIGRKPYMLLAKIEERERNFNAAIRHVEKAIELCKNGKTRYPELDRKYLEYLKDRLSSKGT